MGKTAEHRYLQPPHIQLGFYWDEIAETEAYRMMLRWLVGRGYRLTPPVVLIRSYGGGLPRFAQLATHDLPDEDVVGVDHWTIEKTLSAEDWLPVYTFLAPTRSEDVEIDLGYALMHKESLEGGDHHVIEIIASGMASNLLENVGASRLDPELLKQACITDRWCGDTFRAACDELSPDYAAWRWEWALQPPKSLLVSRDPHEFADMYVSDSVADPELVAAGLATLGGWSVQRYGKGVFVQLVGKNREADLDASREGAELIRTFLKRAYEET